MEWISDFGQKWAEFSLKMQRTNFKSDTKRRLRYYSLLRDYINSPSATTAESFFSWYPNQLDMRVEKGPFLARKYFELTKQKNESALRGLMQDGWSRHDSGEGLNSILKDWIPDDEHRVLSASSSSDITESLDIIIDMCNDKINNSKQITGAIKSNIPIILISTMLHYIIFSMLYTSFVSPMVFETAPSELTPIEQNYLTYHWLGQPVNIAIVIATIALIVVGFRWSISNWSKRAIVLREEFFDFIPPWSLSKINQQYQVLMIVNNFLESGASFMEALEQARKGSSPYVQRQIDKILSNSSTAPNKAINTLFFGEMGNIIRERGEHVNLSVAIKTLVPKLREMKKEKFDSTMSVITSYTIKPMIYLSLAWSLWPVVAHFASLLSGIQSAGM